MELAFVGFGEAAQALAAGLHRESSALRMRAFDPRFAAAEGRAEMDRLGAEKGVSICDTVSDAVQGADIVLSLVVGSAAVQAAESVAAVLGREQIYIDLNSVSPDRKLKVQHALAKSGEARFVEGSVLARVAGCEHKVPILLAGAAAGEAAASLNALGMNCEAVGKEIGQAGAVKMIRSVFVKGIEALLIECLTAAERAGVRERILDSISETFPGTDWRETSTYYIGRTHIHGARRVTELGEAAVTLEGLGMEPVLSRGIADTIGRAHAALRNSGLVENVDYVKLLAVLAGAERR